MTKLRLSFAESYKGTGFGFQVSEKAFGFTAT
jgi:hypothetical protein